MGWICPTFQRPERLAELALSWEKCEPGRQLWVRVWENDPRKEDYFRFEWPDGWVLFEHESEWCGQALNTYFDWNPNEAYYGFIADDIVLRTPGGLGELEQAAGDWCVAYPNDTIHRHRGCTHFCVGGQFARKLNYFVPRELKHHFIDNALMSIASNCGLDRYCPWVIFQHKHFLAGTAERDATYEKIWGEVTRQQVAEMDLLPQGEVEFASWVKDKLPSEVNKIREEMLKFERWHQWEAEDAVDSLEAAHGAV